jgi:CMP-2-keto-3-deoxyoctulosonic acid synthetase
MADREGATVSVRVHAGLYTEFRTALNEYLDHAPTPSERYQRMLFVMRLLGGGFGNKE